MPAVASEDDWKRKKWRNSETKSVKTRFVRTSNCDSDSQCKSDERVDRDELAEGSESTFTSKYSSGEVH
jgi:hypothetical protein